MNNRKSSVNENRHVIRLSWEGYGLIDRNYEDDLPTENTNKWFPLRRYVANTCKNKNPNLTSMIPRIDFWTKEELVAPQRSEKSPYSKRVSLVLEPNLYIKCKKLLQSRINTPSTFIRPNGPGSSYNLTPSTRRGRAATSQGGRFSKIPLEKSSKRSIHIVRSKQTNTPCKFVPNSDLIFDLDKAFA